MSELEDFVGKLGQIQRGGRTLTVRVVGYTYGGDLIVFAYRPWSAPEPFVIRPDQIRLEPTRSTA